MMRCAAVVILAALVSGCAGMTGPGGILYRQTQQIRLSKAITLQEKGKAVPAEQLLTSICTEKGVAGVTDEALFRLSLYRLDAGISGDGVRQARQYLDLLRKEYPSSPWAPLAAQLSRYLASAGDQQQHDMKLKEQNSSLTKENKELHQRLDMLKKLELELGKGTGR
jgi:hypothetical protein